MKPNDEAPEDSKLFYFDKIVTITSHPLFKAIKLIPNLLFVEVAPDIPISLKKSFTRSSGKRALIIGASLAFIFCFCVNFIGSYLNGTLYGEDPQRIYFLQDKWNILLYTLICPAYVGFTCWLVVIVVKAWGDINDFKNHELEENQRNYYGPIKATILGLLILSVAFFLTTNYINDIMKLVENETYYWFLNDNYQLGSFGIYYFLLNFSLLIVTLIALTFFMSIYKLVLDVGNGLSKKEEVGKLEFDQLKIKLEAFTEAYMVTKFIIAAYIFNILIWAFSPLGKGVTDNFEIAVVLLAIIGLILLSFPRLFVELQWHKLKARSPHDFDMRYDDLRDKRIKHVVYILDTFFISSFTFGSINSIYDFSQLLK